LLQEEGEPIAIKEMTDILGKLMSELSITKALPEAISAERFAEDVLGFEEVDELEGDQEEAEEEG